MDGQFKIQSMWAFVVVDDDGTEGVIGRTVPGLGFTPLVGADLARIKDLMPYAQSVATTLGKPVTLAHFSVRTDADVITPKAILTL